MCFFFFSSRRRHTRCLSDWSSDVCSSDLGAPQSQRTRFDGALARGENLHRVALPGGTVQDGLPVGSEAGRTNFAAAEGDLVIERCTGSGGSPQTLAQQESGCQGDQQADADQSRQKTSSAPGLCWNFFPTVALYATRRGCRGHPADPCARGIRVTLQTLQVRAKFRRALTAQLPVLLQSFVQDGFELRRQARIQLNR